MAKYIALSDLHLGQNGKDCKGQFSLLSQVPDECPAEKERAVSTMNKLCQKVKDFAGNDPVTLIVTGDLLDLAMAYLHDGLQDLVCLLKNLTPVKRLVWVIGNHDHHIWSLHAEETRSLAPLRAGHLPLPGGIYRPTKPEGEDLSLLRTMLSKNVGHDLAVDIAYPAFRLTLHDNKGGLPPELQKVQFYFTHGHLLGGIYTTVSQILAPRLPGFAPEQTAATVNLSLIEFIYWLLGETGEGFGADGFMESVYTDLQKGDSSLVKELINSAVDAFIPEGVIPGVPDSWERSGVKKLGYYLLKKAVGQTDPAKSSNRHQPSEATRREMEAWAINTAKLPTNKRVNVIYGHTHEADLHSIHSTLINAYNLGSWLVEPGLSNPDAQLLMIDDGAQQLDVKWTRI